jgi:hypothetical protein
MDTQELEVLERIAAALEKIAEIQERDYEFRVKAAEEQAALVQRLTGHAAAPVEVPPIREHGRRARRP